MRNLDPGQTLIYYVNEKVPEFSIQHLGASIIAVTTVVAIEIVVLVFFQKKRIANGKVEIKEIGEMHRELNA